MLLEASSLYLDMQEARSGYLEIQEASSGYLEVVVVKQWVSGGAGGMGYLEVLETSLEVSSVYQEVSEADLKV